MEYLINVILTLGGSIIGYLFAQRKTNAETDSIVIANVKEILDVYAKTIQDLKTEIGELKDKIEAYEQQITCLNTELHAFRKEMSKNVESN